MQIVTSITHNRISRTAIAPKKDGYFYTYVTNRSAGKVHFDNMVIKRWAPQVRVAYDYYPYGLTWEDPRLPGSPESIHDHCYQDKEFQWAEFTTGHGLALHDFHARMYDGATGRWLVPDPAAQFANPYLAMGNNPVVVVDPDGRFVHILIGAGIGGLINLGMKAMNGEINSFGEGLAAFGVGAVAGGLTAATGGAMLAAAGGVGAGGFAGGFVIGAMSTTAGNVVLSEGNHYFFNDPRWDDKQYLTSALMGGVLGGVANGFAAKGQGKSFWTGGEKSELLNILPPGPGSNPKPYTGRTGNGGATNEMLYDELGNPINPKAIIYNESAGPELRIFGERSGSTIKVENFKYNEVVDYISHDASQVRSFSNAPGSEIIHLTPDGAILRYQAYPVSRTTSAPTIKLSYWNSTSETFEHWMTFRFTP